MGLKDKMMDSMMGKMSAEEKKEMMDNMMGSFMDSMSSEEKQNMMNSMMDKFFAGMSPDEKQGMMSSMMPKMMGSMMGSGSGGGSSMMGMMKNMMGGMMGKKEGDKNNPGPMEFNPMEMCQKMMGNMGRTNELAAYATPEVRALFEDWSEQIENEILGYIKNNNNADPEKIAEHFKLSKDSINFFITKLSQKGKINIKAEAK